MILKLKLYIIMVSNVCLVMKLIFTFQVLDFPGNPIKILEDDVFVHQNLLNLQAVVLRACEIHTVEPQAFR